MRLSELQGESYGTPHTMEYQLVLQWPASAITDYDAMIEIEDALVEGLSGASDVDGHDAGSGEVNIFIQSNNPQVTFDEIKSILNSRSVWAGARVAYREVEGDKYVILWPPGLTNFKVS